MQPAVDRSDRIDHEGIQLQQRRSLPLGGPAKDLRGLAADDEQDGFVRRRLFDDALAGDATVAQHHHPVGDFEHLVQPMRNIDHADAAIAQAPQCGEQSHDLIRRQARGRLVEHQDLGVGGKRPRDRDERFLGAGEVLNS